MPAREKSDANGCLPACGADVSCAQGFPALQRVQQLFFDGAVSGLKGDGFGQVALVERAVGQLGADGGLLGFQCVDAGGQGVQLALLFVAELAFDGGLGGRFGGRSGGGLGCRRGGLRGRAERFGCFGCRRGRVRFAAASR